MFGIQKSRGFLALTAACSVGVMMASTAAGNAQINGSLWLNNANASDATLTATAAAGTPDATFASTGINYNPSDTGANYTPNSFLNSPTFMNTSAGFSPTANLDNTLFLFTGSVFLNSGANTFVVGHDDGLQLNIDGIGMVVDDPGPTALAETPFTVTAPSSGEYSFELSYGECCGPPASLVWDINNQIVGTVPDATSTLSLLGISLSGLMALGRRVKK